MKAARVLSIWLIALFVIPPSFTISAISRQPSSFRSVQVAGMPTTSAQARQSTAAWTVMVYFAADNDLEGFGLADLDEMEFVGSTTEVNVVAQMDRAVAYDSSNDDWTDARRFFVNRDTNLSQITSEQVATLGETNTGDPDTLAEFAIWAMNTYPAERYALIIWDHGGSWLGVATDLSDSYDDLTLPELDRAFQRITNTTGVEQLDVIGFDACLMGAFEVYRTIAPYARYGIGSPELIPGNGWDYLGALDALAANPAMDGEEFGRAVVDSFIQFYTETVTNYSVFNLGVVDLSRTNEVITALESFSDTVYNDPNVVLDAVSEARSQTPLFGAFDDPQFVDYWAAADLVQFMRLLAEKLPASDVQNAAENVSDMGAEMVIYYRSQTDADAVSGMSIFFPRNLGLYREENRADRYVQEAPSGLAFWQAFLDAFYNSATLASNAAELEGTVRDIAVEGDQVAIELGLSDSVQQTAVFISLDVGGGQSIIVDYIRPVSTDAAPTKSFHWSGQMPWLTNGVSQVPVLIVRNRYNTDLGIINGTFHPQNGLPVKAQLVVDLQTNLVIHVWGIQESAHSLMPFEIQPQSGDIFQPTWFSLDAEGRLVSRPAMTRLVFPDLSATASVGKADLRPAADQSPRPFYILWAGAQPGGYNFTAQVEDMAGNTGQGQTLALVPEDGFDVEILGATDTDYDDDSILNDDDNCPFVPNTDQADLDGDGIGDVCDLFDDRDPDQDGIVSDEDNCPDIANVDQADSDSDGVGDVCDGVLDQDGDGIPDHLDNCPTVSNPGQHDSDYNGLGNACDIQPDRDGDGVIDRVDNCPDIPNADQADADQDFIGDVCDDAARLDRDGDGILDHVDNCPDVPNTDQADSNGNYIGDACEAMVDSDGDGIADPNDNCRFVYNTDQVDSDQNGLGDVCDTPPDVTETPSWLFDYDEDGIFDSMDNCPFDYNPGQEDNDFDGIGDICDA